MKPLEWPYNLFALRPINLKQIHRDGVWIDRKWNEMKYEMIWNMKWDGIWNKKEIWEIMIVKVEVNQQTCGIYWW